jgi:hypothetical protein
VYTLEDRQWSCERQEREAAGESYSMAEEGELGLNGWKHDNEGERVNCYESSHYSRVLMSRLSTLI